MKQLTDSNANLNTELIAARYHRWFHPQGGLARANQLPPSGNWSNWLVLAGRGFGKTRLGAEWIAAQAVTHPNSRSAIIARTYSDVRNVCVEGVSGILDIIREYGILENWNKSSGIISLTNGSIIQTFSADTPDSLRGPQFHFAWTDELAAWEYPETFDQLMFGMRLGEHPQTVITTTPRPTPLIKKVMANPSTTITRGSTFDNSENLAPSALAELQLRYAGTRLGQQELYGEILDDNPGALWTRSLIESNRIKLEDVPPLIRVVVGIDPAVTSGEDSDYTGIVSAGVTADGHYYILADDTLKASPQMWATKAVDAYKKHNADRIVAEVNNGGDLVINLLQQVNSIVPTRKVTATRGKRLRAEPVAALMEQNRCHIVGYLGELEDQMCEWTPEATKSPDRLDAMVWAITDLMESGASLMSLGAMAKFCPNCRLPNPKTANKCSKCFTQLGE